MLVMLGFVMDCCDDLMIGLLDEWWIVHSSKHIMTDNPARQCLYITYKTQCDGIMWRAYTHAHAQARGGARAPAHPRRHTRTNCMLNTYNPHTQELLWAR